MDPQLQKIFDELKSVGNSVADLKSSLTTRIDGVEKALGDRFENLESAAKVLDDWKPKVDASIEDLRIEVGAMRKTVNRVVFDSSAPSTAGIFPKPSPAGMTSSTALQSEGTEEHRAELPHKDSGFGSVFTHTHHSGKGMFEHHSSQIPKSMSQPKIEIPHFNSDPHFRQSCRSPKDGNSSQSRLPKLNFPTFDGENPKLWISRCQDYLEFYDVEPHRWIMVSTMHFKDAAARWLQSVEKRLKFISWKEFCSMVLDRFGRDQHEILIRQLFHIKQVDSVKEYIDQFTELVDQLAAYESKTDPLYFTLRFIDGLRDEIKSTILVQRPQDLDSACVLAQIQEEVGDPYKKKEVRRQDYYSKPAYKSPLPLPPPPKLDKPITSAAQDRRGLEAARNKSAEDKWASIRSFRRAKGLCQYCAEKWSRDHKCADTVQLQALQEVLQVFEIEEDVKSVISNSHSFLDQVFLTVSVAAMTGAPAPRTMSLSGILQGKAINILVDSGSSHTFISCQLAESLQGVSPLDSALKVQVANGGLLHCVSHIPDAVWSVQGHLFTSDVKVLSLSSYDMILGLDWLEQHSPMKVHWRQKWMQIPYQTDVVTLYGVVPSLPDGAIVQVCSVEVIADEEVKVHIPAEIQSLIEEFAGLFEVPSELPPSRSCDHSIPLVEGAVPVNVRPYRFAPALKDEIERQVSEMLKQGIIQKSNSPFSSSVLLVKKKDGTWRFCVDYRHLNAITLKSKYPVPIIDEFLDELYQASWFSCLDLAAGFHQIRMKEGEEYKTAFQTHHGHFEFRVMAFGLTGAPGSFQDAMNSTLAPFLRKFVLVFFDDILIYSKSFDEHVIHVRQVFEQLSKEKWKVKLSKCSFAQRQVAYLGHVISEKGVATDPKKVSAIAQWPVPINTKELRSFLGLAGYYRKFIKHFGIISKPLTNLLKKHSLFIWTVEHDTAFNCLKSALSSSPTLALPDFSQPFCLETDASDLGVGAVLMQRGHPSAYFSKALGPRSKGLSTYEKEYMAILLAVQQWRSYLQHGEFTIFTDQRSLVQLSEQRLHTHWQKEVFTKLLGMQYKIVYKKGEDNRVADALSRKPFQESRCAAISQSQPSWLLEVVSGYSGDAATLDILAKLSLDSTAVPNFTLSQGVLRYKGRIWLGNNLVLQQKVIEAMHSSAVGGHSGVPVTYMRLKKVFAWKGMKSSVHQFVKSCLICQQAKPDRTKLPGLLQPLPVASAAWQLITMDFIEGLPTSSNANCILVVVDTLTKYAHFIPL
ncbi:unnamed protein product [Urochloa humidicola]